MIVLANREIPRNTQDSFTLESVGACIGTGIGLPCWKLTFTCSKMEIRSSRHVACKHTGSMEWYSVSHGVYI